MKKYSLYAGLIVSLFSVNAALAQADPTDASAFRKSSDTGALQSEFINYYKGLGKDDFSSSVGGLQLEGLTLDSMSEMNLQGMDFSTIQQYFRSGMTQIGAMCLKMGVDCSWLVNFSPRAGFSSLAKLAPDQLRSIGEKVSQKADTSFTGRTPQELETFKQQTNRFYTGLANMNEQERSEYLKVLDAEIKK